MCIFCMCIQARQLVKMDLFGPGNMVCVQCIAIIHIALGSANILRIKGHSQDKMDKREIVRQLSGILSASTRNWFALIEDAEEMRRNWHLRMDDVEWKTHCKDIIRTWSGDLRACFNYLDRIDTLRAAAAPQLTVPEPLTPAQITFRAWRDMVLEPWKYGDDAWAEWLQWNDELEASAGRWRVAAFWLGLQEEAEAKDRREAAVKIQALVRGHLVRNSANFRDCCMCLAHRICSLKTDVGMMCRGCAEQGPYDEETGPLPDPWSEFRGEYPAPIEEEPPRSCLGCGDDVYGGGRFCCAECREDVITDAWHGRD